MLEFLVTGIILGLSAGLAPGPLLALVIAEGLQHGIGAGIKVSLAPLISDPPIILVTVILFTKLGAAQSVLGGVSLAGALFLFSMGYQNLHTTNLSLQAGNTHGGKPLFKGVLANALNPHPYLFWLSVGGTYLTQAMSLGLTAPVLFLAGFYTCLVGSKVVLAILVGRSRSILNGPRLLKIFRLLGVLLCLLALGLMRDGMVLLGIG
jgi:threonine/homoserine/homoserine lactone efflux protein